MGWGFAVSSIEQSTLRGSSAPTAVLPGLQAWVPGCSDLEDVLSQIRQEFPMQFQTEFRVIVVGTPRSLQTSVCDEVYLITHEALSNAFRHSGATSIEIELEYAAGRFRVLVRDNGVGINPQVLARGSDMHWGLSEMMERSERIGGKLRILSHPAAGTEIELCVPRDIAFQRTSENSAVGWLSRLYS